MTTKQAAQRLQVTHVQVCRYIKHGTVPYPGARRVYLQSTSRPFLRGEVRTQYVISPEQLAWFKAARKAAVAEVRGKSW